MEFLSRQIEFPPNIRPLAIQPVGVPAPGTIPRSLVRRGELIHLVWRGDDGKLTFGKKFTKTSIYAFLFTDLLVLTKKRHDDAYTVFDYCSRSLLTVTSGDVIPQLPTKEITMAGKLKGQVKEKTQRMFDRSFFFISRQTLNSDDID